MKKIIYIAIADPFSAEANKQSLLETLQDFQEIDLIWRFTQMSSDHFPLGSNLSSFICLKDFFLEKDLNKIEKEINLINESPFKKTLDNLELKGEYFLIRILSFFPEKLESMLSEKKIKFEVLEVKEKQPRPYKFID